MMIIFNHDFNYRSIIIGLFALILLAGCSNDKVGNKVNLTKTSKQLITDHFQMLNAHDLKSLTVQYESKARITTTDWDGVSFGPTGADQIFHQLFYISPDAKYLVDNVVANDSIVVVEYDVVGLREKYNSPMRYDLRNCSIFKIKDNHITSEATYSNSRLYHNQ